MYQDHLNALCQLKGGQENEAENCKKVWTLESMTLADKFNYRPLIYNGGLNKKIDFSSNGGLIREEVY